MNNYDIDNFHYLVFGPQNNSGGIYFYTEDIGDYCAFLVPNIITSDNFYEDDKLNQYFDSIYFYPLDEYNIDCPCCGSRWSKPIVMQNEIFNNFLNNNEKYSIAIHSLDICKKELIFKNIIFDEEFFKYKYDLEDKMLQILYKKYIRENDDSYKYFLKKVNKRRENMTEEEVFAVVDKYKKDTSYHKILFKLYDKYKSENINYKQNIITI